MHRLVAAACIGCVLGWAAAAEAESRAEPAEGAVRVVVPFKPGGSVDVLVRQLLAHWPADSRPDVANVPGKAGVRGANQVVQSQPDGRMLGVGTTELMTIRPFVEPTGYAAPDAYVGLGAIAVNPLLLVARADAPVRDLAALLDKARSSPAGIALGFAGTHSTAHVAVLRLAGTAGIPVQAVAEVSAAAALAALAQGRVDALVMNRVALRKVAGDRDVRVLATFDGRPDPAQPGVPTLRAAGLDVVVEDYVFLFGPSGLPDGFVERMRAGTRAAASEAEFVAALADQGYRALPWSASDLSDRLARDRSAHAALFERGAPAPAGVLQDAREILEPEPGVTVTRITAPPDAHELSYYDIDAYSPVTSRVYVNRSRPGAAGRGRPWDILAIDPATGTAEVLVSRRPPGVSAARFDLSTDGRFISYLRLNDPPEPGFDLYGYRLDRPGEFRITNARYESKTGIVKTSPGVWDAAANQYVIAFGIDAQIYLAHERDGSPSGAGPRRIALDDPDSALPFHRVRLNPVYPHILFYRRETKAPGTRASAAPHMYVADLRSDKPRGVLLFPEQSRAAHPAWTRDGRSIAIARRWTEYAVLDDRGRLLEDLDRQAGPRRVLGPFGSGDPRYPEVFYGAYSPDGRWIAIATSASRDEPGRLFVMDRQGGNVRLLCKTKYFGRYTPGAPRIAFEGDSGRILLSTDASWGRDRPSPPQVYLVDAGLAR